MSRKRKIRVRKRNGGTEDFRIDKFRSSLLRSGADALASLPVSPGPALGKLLGATRRAQDLGRFRTLPGALRWARGELARSD